MGKAIYIACLFIFCLQDCYAQETKEDFLNEVDSILIDFSYRHFYLSPEAQGIWNNYNYDKKEVPKDVLKNILSEQIIMEIYDNAKDTITEYWNFNQLENAKCLLQKEIKSKLSKHHFLSFHKQSKRTIFSISKPVFSNDKEWAVISLSAYSDELHGFSYGGFFVFHKIDGRWEKIARPCWWIT